MLAEMTDLKYQAVYNTLSFELASMSAINVILFWDLRVGPGCSRNTFEGQIVVRELQTVIM